jgi:hypothetical protein
MKRRPQDPRHGAGQRLSLHCAPRRGSPYAPASATSSSERPRGGGGTALRLWLNVGATLARSMLQPE